jgi:ferredoxin-NADP reductase
MSSDGHGSYRLLVDEVRPEADGVLSLRLVRPDGLPLPAWSPGAHLDVVLPSGLIRQYSLCGDPEDRRGFRIAVLREADGRGGSREIHDSALPRLEIGVRGPRNHFPLVEAQRYLFLAGGIGITPILAMARDAGRRGVPWQLVYGGRTRATMAFVEELQGLPGGSVEVLPQDQHGLLPLEQLLDETGAGTGTAVYCCGPEPMVRAVEEISARRLPPGALHVERFSAASGPRVSSPAPDEASDEFEVELRRSGVVLSVPADRTLLDVVRDVVPDAPYSCEEGFCGACETVVLEGVPRHNDTILTDEDRASCSMMMICVGRSCSPRLVLDL